MYTAVQKLNQDAFNFVFIETINRITVCVFLGHALRHGCPQNFCRGIKAPTVHSSLTLHKHFLPYHFSTSPDLSICFFPGTGKCFIAHVWWVGAHVPLALPSHVSELITKCSDTSYMCCAGESSARPTSPVDSTSIRLNYAEPPPPNAS